MFFSKRVKLSVSFLVGNMTNLQVSTCNIGTGLAEKKNSPTQMCFLVKVKRRDLGCKRSDIYWTSALFVC